MKILGSFTQFGFIFVLFVCFFFSFVNLPVKKKLFPSKNTEIAFHIGTGNARVNVSLAK